MQPTHTPTVTRADLVIRAAEETDRAALEAIAAQIWDGDDYLPRVLDEWLKDPHDGFYVATLRDQVVGVVKLTRYAEGEWWMEGLRVDPAYQGHGFGRILHHFVINQVRQRGQGKVRFSTASVNDAVRLLAKETGFVHKATFLPYRADVLDEPVQGWTQLGPDDLARVQAWLDGSEHFQRAQHSLESEWSFYFMTPQRLRERLEAGLVFGWHAESGDLGGVVITNPSGSTDRWPGDPALKIAYFDVPQPALADAARDVRRLAASLDRVVVDAKPLGDVDRIAALESAGYARKWDGEIWLYERDIVLTEHADVRVEDPSALN